MALSSSKAKAQKTPQKSRFKPVQMVQVPLLPSAVHVTGALHGTLPSLWFQYYNVQEEQQFPDLRFTRYAEVSEVADGIQYAHPKKRACTMHKSGIMTLLDAPHFGRSPSVNSCIRFILSRLHGGFLRLDQPYPIDANIIRKVSNLPRTGEDPAAVLQARDANTQEVSKRYGSRRGQRGAQIPLINDPTVRFATQLLSCKLLRKCRKDEYPIGIILATERCVAGVKMAWMPFLLNE